MDSMLEQSMAIARSSAAPKDVLPTLILRRDDGEMLVLMIVADAGDRAVALARKQVRAQSDVLEYALVARTNRSVDDPGGAVEALVYETARRGDPLALRWAQPLSGNGALEELPSARSAFEPVEPSLLDWGSVRPDRVSHDGLQAVHVVNHELSADNLERTTRFLAARLAHHRRHLPPECRQRVWVDDRGQQVLPRLRQQLRARLQNDCEAVLFATGA